MKRITWIVGIAIVALAGLGMYLQIGESIPDHALIDVYPSHWSWTPHSKLASQKFDELLRADTTRPEALALLAEVTLSTYGDVRHGKYRGFQLAPGWATYRDTFTTGYNTSVLGYFLWRPKSRWNADGSWNW